MTEQDIDLERLLQHLSTEEGKAIVITRAVEKASTKNPQHIKRAIQDCVEKEDFYQAAQLAEEAGDLETAISYYIRARYIDTVFGKIELLSNAAKLAERMGDTRRAKMLYEQAIQYHLAGEGPRGYVSSHGYMEAARIAEKIGEFYIALKHYESALNKLVGFNWRDLETGDATTAATRLALSLGNAEKIKGIARVVYTLADKHCEYKKSSIVITESGECILNAAIELAGNLGDLDRAIRYCQEIRRFDRAIILAQKLGDIERVKKIFEEGSGYYERINNFNDAAELEKLVGHFVRANELLEKGISFYEEQAAMGSLKADAYAHATQLAQKLGDIERMNRFSLLAFQHYEKEENFADAAKLAQLVNEPERAEAYKTLAETLDLHGPRIAED